MCLLSTRKSNIRMLPASLLLTGSVLFPGVIFYSKIYNDKSFIKLVMVGGSCTTAGWIAMMLV